jgi:hypothetical protein
MALETYRSAGPAPESKPSQPWAAITGFITTQLCAFWSDGSELYEEIARGRLSRIAWRAHLRVLFQAHESGVRGSCWLALSLSELRKELCQLRTHRLKRELL